jgi:Flp pilus assembly protein TadG
MQHRRVHRDRGSSALELAVIAPVLILIIFSIIQFALWFYGRNVALQAAREGVSTLRLVNDDDPDKRAAALLRVQDDVERYAGVVGQEALLGATAVAEYVGDQRVRVTVTGRAVTLIPGWDITISRTVTGEVEQFEPDRLPGG